MRQRTATSSTDPLAEGKEAYRQKRWRDARNLGLALLRLEQGRLESASASVRRALSEAQGHTARAAILTGYVEIMLAAGDSAAAQAGVAELAEIAAATASDYLHAAACQAQGATLLTQGDLQRALQNLREAAEIWQGLDATYHTARTRLLIGQACLELHDEESARLEVEVARKALTRLGAIPDLKRIDRLFPKPGSPDHPLSRREVEVAELVAQGLSNKVIAGKLFLSERTVESHVKNVCDKLGFNTRAQVASWVTARGRF